MSARLRRSIMPVLVLALLALQATSGVASAATLPCQIPETDRHHVWLVNLDTDSTAERVDVFNFDAAGTPISGLMVCDRVGGEWRRVQVKNIVQSPGARTSGLRGAWAGDLNGDSRLEVAARDFLTPSAGEVLTILRQHTRYARTFDKLQSITGDAVEIVRHHGAAATVSVVLKANHAVDGRQHVETWYWSKPADRWICTSDCGGRTQPSVRCNGSVKGPLGTSAETIRVRAMGCASAFATIHKWLFAPASPIDGFVIDSPGQFQAHGKKGVQEFWFYLKGTD